MLDPRLAGMARVLPLKGKGQHQKNKIFNVRVRVRVRVTVQELKSLGKNCHFKGD